MRVEMTAWRHLVQRDFARDRLDQISATTQGDHREARPEHLSVHFVVSYFQCEVVCPNQSSPVQSSEKVEQCVVSHFSLPSAS